MPKIGILLMMDTGKETISCCMIVKNEEEKLERALKSVVDWVDEIVIVDTGSTDGTIKIAKRYADVFKEVTWKGFADARNHSIDLATKDIIFILDADEILGTNTEQWEAMKLHLVQEKKDAVAIQIYNTLPDKQLLMADVIWQIRAWVNRPEIRYTGRVHNQIAPVFAEHPVTGETVDYQQIPILLTHDGYNLDDEAKKRKYVPRLQLLYTELSDAKEDEAKDRIAYYNYQLVNAHFMLGDSEKAVYYLRECVWDDLTGENLVSMLLMGVHCCVRLGLPQEGHECAKKMLEVQPAEAISFLMMGVSFLGQPVDKRAAYNFLGAAYAMSLLPNPPYKYRLDPHYIAAALGDAAVAINRLKDAKEMFAFSLQKYPNERIQRVHDAIVPKPKKVEIPSLEETQEEVQSIPSLDEQTHLSPQSVKNLTLIADPKLSAQLEESDRTLDTP